MSFASPDLAGLRALKVSCEHLDPKGYVYVLFRQDAPVYVGQAKSIHYAHQQIIEHGRRSKIFDSLAIVECPVAELESVQAEYIVNLRPVYNDRLPSQPVYMSLSVVVRGMKARGYSNGHRRTLERAGIEELYLSSYRAADLKAGGFIT